jgi:hypothetical protein
MSGKSLQRVSGSIPPRPADMLAVLRFNQGLEG